MVKNILGNNSRTRISPDMGFAMESQSSKEISFCIVFREKNEKIFKKMQNNLFLDPLCSNLGKIEFTTKIGLRNF